MSTPQNENSIDRKRPIAYDGSMDQLYKVKRYHMEVESGSRGNNSMNNAINEQKNGNEVISNNDIGRVNDSTSDSSDKSTLLPTETLAKDLTEGNGKEISPKEDDGKSGINFKNDTSKGADIIVSKEMEKTLSGPKLSEKDHVLRSDSASAEPSQPNIVTAKTPASSLKDKGSSNKPSESESHSTIQMADFGKSSIFIYPENSTSETISTETNRINQVISDPPAENTSQQNHYCIECVAVFPTKSLLQKHIEMDPEKNGFKCLRCPKKFRYIHGLKLHLKTHSPGFLACMLCSNTYSSMEKFAAHMDYHRSNVSYQYSVCLNQLLSKSLERMKKQALLAAHACTKCPETFFSKLLLDGHSKTHGIKINKEFIPRQKEVSKSPEPEAWKNTGTETLKNTDTQSFNNIDSRHNSTTQMVQTQLPDSGLPEVSFVSGNKNQAGGTTNNNPQIISVDTPKIMSIDTSKSISSITFQTPSSKISVQSKPGIIDPQSIESSFVPSPETKKIPVSYRCPACPSSFPSKTLLRQHRKTHGLQLFSCSECPNKYATLELLKNHERRVHAVASSKFYQCSQCPQKLSTVTELSDHSKKHRELQDARELSDHSRTNGERKGSCELTDNSRTYGERQDAREFSDHSRTHGERQDTRELSDNSRTHGERQDAHEFTDHSRTHGERNDSCELSDHSRTHGEMQDTRELSDNSRTHGESNDSCELSDHSRTHGEEKDAREFTDHSRTHGERNDSSELSDNSRTYGERQDARESAFVQPKNGSVASKRDVFECPICSYNLSSGELFLEHMKVHLAVKSNRCSQCPAEFYTEQALVDHSLKHTTLLIQRNDSVGFVSSNKFPVPEDVSRVDILNKTITKDLIRNDVVSKPTIANEVVSYKVVPREVVPNEIFPREVALNTIVQNTSVSKEVVSQDVVSQEVVSQDVVRNQIVPKEVVSKNYIPKESLSTKVSSKDIISKKDLPNIHLPSKSFTIEKPQKCSICRDIFFTAANLKTHMQSHEGEKPPTPKYTVRFSFSCNECQQRFPSQLALDGHMRIHTSGKIYQCHKCVERFKNKGALENHLRIHFSDSDSGTKRSTKVASSLISDTVTPSRETNGRLRNLTCEICQKHFPSENSYKVHIQKHMGQACFPCVVCDEKLTSRQLLLSHLTTHMSDNDSCKICSRVFFTKLSFAEHMLTHPKPQNSTPEETAKFVEDIMFTYTGEIFRCKMCHLAFNSQSALSAHMCQHSDSISSCNVCKMVYSSKSELAAHMETHAKRSHQCVLCLTEFNSESALKSHTKTHLNTKKAWLS